MYDVIVVGARVAGASTAMLLARKGYRVLLLDRATFPSDIPHGHMIHRHGPGRLQRWGLLDRVLATNCPPVTQMTLDNGETSLVGQGLMVDGVPLGCGPRRVALDKVLVDAAVEAGAELRQAFTVREFISEGGCITGISGHDRSSSGAITEKAAIIVGADGRNSRLAATVKAPVYEATPPLTCWYFSYWSGVPEKGLEVYTRQNKVILAFPTNDRLVSVAIAWQATELARVRGNIEAEFMSALDTVPELAERVRSGNREERFYGATDLPNFYRKPYGPGWALVGDAGCHKDPFLALGICDALRDAELLADAINEGLSGHSPLDAAMSDYEHRRNEASGPDYRMNLSAARFEPSSPQQHRLFAALRGNQEDTNLMFMAQEGMLPEESFFNPDNLQRIMARAWNTA